MGGGAPLGNVTRFVRRAYQGDGEELRVSGDGVGGWLDRLGILDLSGACAGAGGELVELKIVVGRVGGW